MSLASQDVITFGDLRKQNKTYDTKQDPVDEWLNMWSVCAMEYYIAVPSQVQRLSVSTIPSIIGNNIHTASKTFPGFQ